MALEHPDLDGPSPQPVVAALLHVWAWATAIPLAAVTFVPHTGKQKSAMR